jgi:hypothetical protein
LSVGAYRRTCFQTFPAIPPIKTSFFIKNKPFPQKVLPEKENEFSVGKIKMGIIIKKTCFYSQDFKEE